MAAITPTSGPTLSVIVSAYNAERHIAETLESLLSQTLPPHEVIVIDDGSTDSTLAVVRRYDRHIKVISQPNGGQSAAQNTGSRRASGDYVARCDSDDLWLPTKLERQAQALAAHPEVDIAFAGAHVFGEADRPFDEFAGAAAVAPPPGVVSDRRAFVRNLYRANMICASSVVIRRDLLGRLGPYAGYVEDYEYWLRAARAGAVFFYDPTVLVKYRRHSASVSSDVVRMYEETHHLHLRYRGLTEGRAWEHKTLAADRFESARALLSLGDEVAARLALRDSLRHWPRAQTAAWAALLMLPSNLRPRLIGLLRGARRAIARSETTGSPEASPTPGD